MTLRELKSQRKAKAIKYLVDDGEYSVGFGSREAERLNDEGLILDVDYIPLANYLDELMEREIAERDNPSTSAENEEILQSSAEETAEESEVE